MESWSMRFRLIGGADGCVGCCCGPVRMIEFGLLVNMIVWAGPTLFVWQSRLIILEEEFRQWKRKKIVRTWLGCCLLLMYYYYCWWRRLHWLMMQENSMLIAKQVHWYQSLKHSYPGQLNGKEIFQSLSLLERFLPSRILPVMIRPIFAVGCWVEKLFIGVCCFI